MKASSSVPLAFLSFALAAACGPDFDPGSRVTDFRLIAVTADKPYAAPGEKVTLRTLHHEPFGRPITWAWTVCLNPRDTTVPACFRSLVERARAGENIPVESAVGRDGFEWSVPADAISRLPPQGRGGAMAGVVTVACPGTLTVDPLGSASFTALPFRCIESGSGVELPYERYVVSVKRIFLRERDKNQNPSIAGVTWDGAPWPENEVRETRSCENDTNMYTDCTRGEQHYVAAIPAAGAAESGIDELGVPFTEQVVVQTYSTDGTFQFQAKNGDLAAEGSGWFARRSSRGKELTMWFVVRESRGGVSWTSRRVRVLP